MNLKFFAELLTNYWYILIPLLLISGSEARAKKSRARIIQILARIVGFVAVVIVTLGIFGLLIH